MTRQMNEKEGKMRKNLRIVFAISTTLDEEESQPGGKINEKLFRTLS